MLMLLLYILCYYLYDAKSQSISLNLQYMMYIHSIIFIIVSIMASYLVIFYILSIVVLE